MDKIKKWVKRHLIGLPIATIVISSFLNIQTRGQQALVLFTIIWFYVFLLMDVFNK